MSNSKVRIYELSKELHLDNKDILEICEQLNISVKSHSSTITESEAERIKIMADKYHQQKVKGKPHSSHGQEREQIERKQEILAIHKQNRPSSHSKAAGTAKTVTPVLMEPVRPTGQPKTGVASLKPSADKVATLATEKDESPEALPKTREPELKIPTKSPTKTTEDPKTVTESDLNVPKLLNPPPRSSEPKTQAQPPEGQAESLETKPIPSLEKPSLETQKTGKISKNKKSKDSTPEIKKGDKSEAKQADKPKRKPSSDGKKQARVAKPSLELKRPTPPQPPQKLKAEDELPPVELEADELQEEDILEDDDTIEKIKQKPKLKRPTPPRISKQKDWEDEEDEKEDSKTKTGKVSKTGKKRRSQLVLEDDEDFDSQLDENLELATTVSLSIARPPKPQSMMKPDTGKSSGKKQKPTPKSEVTPTKAKVDRRERKEEVPAESIVLEGNMTVRELSERMNVPETDIIKNLFFKGIAVNITQTLDLDTIQMVVEEFGIQALTPEEKAAAAKTTEMLDADDLENLQTRPPVVTIMGHVDHGKTTLLDSIRKTKVAQGEAGGITQHIGAYHVDLEHNGETQQIVFLDTPGHEAFTAMRARGTRVTDIAVLVVAADDGVQPQTREAISHARAAEVPIVVAINKIDKPEANPDRIKQELSELGLVPEEWGGDTTMVPVSALKGENLDELLEMLLLVAEIEELSANPDRKAKGTVIEANLDRTRGPVATLLVQNGTLRVGDTIVAGSVLGKIRAMIDDRGNRVEVATPSFAVEVLGLNDVPAAGDEFDVYDSEKEARAIAEQRTSEQRQTRLQQALSSRRVSLSSLSAQAQEGELKELNLILKADVQGSVEAILGSLKQLPQKEVQIRVLLAAPGEVTETDVDLAAASGAVIVGFNTTLASGARAAADQEGVDIREYNIIYKLLDDIQGAMEGLLDPEEVEESLGTAEVRAVFSVGRGAVAGCYVQSGKIVRNRLMRVRRKGEVIFEGVIDSLKRIKEDAREVNAGYECGIGSPKFNDWQEGDIIEAYEMVMKRRTLSV